MSSTATVTIAPVKDKDTKKDETVYLPGTDLVFPSTLVPTDLSSGKPCQIDEIFQNDYKKLGYKYAHYLPVTSYPGKTLEPDYVEFKHEDVGKRADPSKAALFAAMPYRKDMTPWLGTEVKGVQLTQLTPKQKDELALYIAERGVVVFRDQDLLDVGFEKQKEFGRYFGPLHVHQFGSHARDHPELMTVFRDSTNHYCDNATAGKLTSYKAHSDMTYEVNAVGTTFLMALARPKIGGDTLFLHTQVAYERLSPIMKAFLDPLEAVHSGLEQAQDALKTGIHRRKPIQTVHPVVRVHPATGKKSLWVNRHYTRYIVGMKKPESDAILTLLFDHLERGLDFHVRANYEENTVVAYDNRVVQHSAILDYELGNGQFRHLLRITPRAERPFNPAVKTHSKV